MIPIAKPHIDEKDIEGVKKVLESGMLSLGPKLSEFEEKFAEFIGTKYAIAVSSGTSGLHLCMKALNLKEDDEIITSPFSFISSSNCILYEKAKPVFVDINEQTKNIDPEQIEKAITPKTKAILPVHIFGEPCDMESIIKIAEKYKIPVIEDACEAIGTIYNGKKVGSFGLASVFAFYANKQMTTGEGGIVCTNNEMVYNLCKSLRNQGRAEDMQWLDHNKLGFNYRLNDLSCSLGITQLQKIDFLIKEKEVLAKKYNEILLDIPNIKLPKETEHKSWFVYTINLDQKYNRDKIIKEMQKRGIATKPYLPSIHLQKFYRDTFNYKEGDFPVSEKISNTSLALPFFIGLKDDEINYIKQNLKEVLQSDEFLRR
jgi:perosamine synthetase